MLTVSLGNWQSGRAREKEASAAAPRCRWAGRLRFISVQRRRMPRRWICAGSSPAASGSPSAWSCTTTGTRRGQPGYHVLMPLQTGGRNPACAGQSRLDCGRPRPFGAAADRDTAWYGERGRGRPRSGRQGVRTGRRHAAGRVWQNVTLPALPRLVRTAAAAGGGAADQRRRRRTGARMGPSGPRHRQASRLRAAVVSPWRRWRRCCCWCCP
ncbi:MAG: hypothetical protein MZW92_11090 [Comamonadaceae bacterium]|nr:hypothetical protein [Comamonadaceae bacterium]